MQGILTTKPFSKEGKERYHEAFQRAWWDGVALESVRVADALFDELERVEE